MTLAEALAGVEVPSVRPTMELVHRYGAELKPGMHVDLSDRDGVVELYRLDCVVNSRAAGRWYLILDFSDGRSIATSTDSSWYVEA